MPAALQPAGPSCSGRPASGPASGPWHWPAAARAPAALAPRPARAGRSPRLAVCAGVIAPDSLVLVAGATGGVGQLVCAKLLERGHRVTAVARPRSKDALQGYGPDLEVVSADLRVRADVDRLLAGGVAAVVCATGTTAFPSKRWEGNNGPLPTDWTATSNLINAAAARSARLARFVLVTSAGVERQRQLPWAILNTFGVLRYKRDTEVLLAGSGLPYTVVRPSRLTDGPYTSYDLNTLLKATAGLRRDVTLSLTDSLAGEASRVSTAEAVVQALLSPEAENKAFALCSTEGEGPGSDSARWKQLFMRA